MRAALTWVPSLIFILAMETHYPLPGDLESAGGQVMFGLCVLVVALGWIYSRRRRAAMNRDAA